MIALSNVYISISIIALLVIFILVFFVRKNKEKKKFSLLVSLAFLFVIAGIVFGDNRLTGYTLISMGVVLAIIDLFRKSKRE